MIIYFTGTGNSRYCAKMIAEKLGDEMVDVFHYIKDGIAGEFITGKPWVFVTPTYAWQLPRIFVDFMRSANFDGSKDAYFVMTCGSDIGNAGEYIAELCREIGLNYKGVLEVVMPENYIAMFKAPDAKESAEIIEKAVPVLENGIKLIQNGKNLPEKEVNFTDRKKSGLTNKLFYKVTVTAKHFYTTDACIGCGKCAESCVLGNITLTDGKPKWGDKCTHCMACICGCPTEAVEYGNHAKGKVRYQCVEYM